MRGLVSEPRIIGFAAQYDRPVITKRGDLAMAFAHECRADALTLAVGMDGQGCECRDRMGADRGGRKQDMSHDLIILHGDQRQCAVTAGAQGVDQILFGAVAVRCTGKREGHQLVNGWQIGRGFGTDYYI